MVDYDIKEEGVITETKVISQADSNTYRYIMMKQEEVKRLESQFFALKIKEVMEIENVDNVKIFIDYGGKNGDRFEVYVSKRDPDSYFEGIYEVGRDDNLSEYLEDFVSNNVILDFKCRVMKLTGCGATTYSVKDKGVDGMLLDFFGDKEYALYQSYKIGDDIKNGVSNKKSKNKLKV